MGVNPLRDDPWETSEEEAGRAIPLPPYLYQLFERTAFFASGPKKTRILSGQAC